MNTIIPDDIFQATKMTEDELKLEIAIMLYQQQKISSGKVRNWTGLTVIEVSVKGTGFDFWLGTKGETGNLFQRKARLEVSGILNGNPSQVKARVKTKLKQISPTDKLSYPGFVSVVEFSSFKMVLLQKKVGDINE